MDNDPLSALLSLLGPSVATPNVQARSLNPTAGPPQAPPPTPPAPSMVQALTQPQAPAPQLQPPVDQTSPDIPVQARIPYDYHGMFGIHGALRNILGTIGDAFLVQGGHPAIFGPRLHDEAVANEQRGFTTDPAGAIERVNRDDPVGARELFEQNLRNQTYAAGRQSQIAQRQEAIQDRTRAAIGALGNAATPQTWAGIRPRLISMAQAAGLDLPPEMVPETYSDGVSEGLLRYGTPPGTQMTADNLVEWRERRGGQIDRTIAERGRHNQATEGIGQENAETGRSRAQTQQTQGAGRLSVEQQREARLAAQQTWEQAHPSRNRRNLAPPSITSSVPGANAPAPSHDNQVLRARNSAGQVTNVWVAQGGRWVHHPELIGR